MAEANVQSLSSSKETEPTVNTRKNMKFSKYQAFQTAIPCEWKSTNGSLCGSLFSDMLSFTTHVKEHILHSEGKVCYWNGCDFALMGTVTRSFTEHVLFHPFHSYLKVLGSELQTKLSLPDCQMDECFKNLVPAMNSELKCLWDDGACCVTFESVGEFYNHVSHHVMSQEVSLCQCKWKGTVIISD